MALTELDRAGGHGAKERRKNSAVHYLVSPPTDYNTTESLMTFNHANELPGTEKIVSGITPANPGLVTTSAAHGYADDDYVIIKDTIGMQEVNLTVHQITVASTTTYSIGNTTGFTALTAAGICRKLKDYDAATHQSTVIPVNGMQGFTARIRNKSEGADTATVNIQFYGHADKNPPAWVSSTWEDKRWSKTGAVIAITTTSNSGFKAFLRQNLTAFGAICVTADGSGGTAGDVSVEINLME